jgi:predicted ATPase
VTRRLAALDTDSDRVLHAAAVVGRRFDWTLLGPAVELDETTVLAALCGQLRSAS